MMSRLMVASSALMLMTGMAVADSNSKSLQPLTSASTPSSCKLPASPDLYFDQDNAAFRSTEVAGMFLSEAQKTLPVLTPADKKSDPYYVIHVVHWNQAGAVDPKDATKTGFNATVDKQNWYIYHTGRWSNEDFSSRNRLFGVKRIYFLYVELNGPGTQVLPIYTLNYVEKTADNVNNLLTLISFFLPTGQTAKGGGIDTNAVPCGGGYFDDIKAPSNVTISVSYKTETTTTDVKPAATGGAASQGPEFALGGPHEDTSVEDAPPPPAITKPAASITTAGATPSTNSSPAFDNEGKYWWDVSVAVPITKLSQTAIDTTAGTITPTKVNQQSAFAAVDLYPIPVDTKRMVNSFVPHFVGGFSLASQPLHKILLAAGIGPAFANFFLGVVLVDQPQLAVTMPAAKVSSGFSPQFAFGINLQVKAFKSTLSSSSK